MTKEQKEAMDTSKMKTTFNLSEETIKDIADRLVTYMDNKAVMQVGGTVKTSDITLLDFFAGCASVALMPVSLSNDACAKSSYEFALAMIRQRYIDHNVKEDTANAFEVQEDETTPKPEENNVKPFFREQEYKIGEKAKVRDDTIVECTDEEKKGCCDGCFFSNRLCYCPYNNTEALLCYQLNRQDRKNVIFKEIKI